jgi:hypothetical protein
MRPLFLAFVFVIAAALPVFGQVPGTYRLTICVRPCIESDTGVVVRGHLVIFQDSIRVDTLSEALQKGVTRLSSRMSLRPAASNACFALPERRKEIDGKELYAGIIPSAFTLIRSGPLGVTTMLYRSPDASYSLVGYFKSGRYIGEGHQRNCCGGAPPSTFFLAVRTGDPDIRTCL